MNVKEWCLHYPEWCYICDSFKMGGGFGRSGVEPEWKDYTAETVHIWQRAKEYVRIIEEACKSDDILLAVTEDIPPEMLGLSIDVVNSTYDIIEEQLKILRR